MKRKLLFALIALLAAITSAQAKVLIDGLYYNLDATTRTAEITNYSYVSRELTIPETVTSSGITYSVTSIGESAFSNCSSLTSVNIPNSVTSIGNFAFAYCSSLTSITIPNSVTSIGNHAFYGCSGLTSVTIPESVTSIDYSAFYNCSGLKSVTIPNSVTSIGDRAFYGCSGLTSIKVEQGNTKYDSREDCNAIIETITNTLIQGCMNTIIPNSVTSIGDYAFWSCSGLTSVTIPESVTSIGYSAFRNCSSLTSITIPNSVTSIGAYAFYGCSSLTSITIPNSVTSIGIQAFYNCSGLKSVTIPNSVTSIGSSAFEDCSSLTSVTIGNSVTSIGASAFRNCIGLTSVTIPNSVISIGDYAFSNCSNLTSVTISKSVTSIGKYVFSDCTSLTSVTIPESVTSIGDGAFYECRKLSSVSIGSGVKRIGVSSFEGCISLKEIIIPEGVESICARSFNGCSSLETFNIPSTVTTFGGTSGTAIYNTVIWNDVRRWENGVLYLDNWLIKAEKTMGFIDNSYKIKEGTRGIGGSSFKDIHIVNITIPESVKYICERAFYNGFSTMTIKSWTPPILENEAFGNVSLSVPIYIHCESLSVYQNAIGWSDFTNFVNNLYRYDIILEVENPIMGQANVLKYPDCETAEAFVEAWANDGYYFSHWSDGSTLNPRSVVLINDVTLKAELFKLGKGAGKCGDNLFWSLEDSTLLITGVGEMYSYVDSLQPWNGTRDHIRSISFPAGLTTIGDYAFYDCKNLKTILLPQNITKIGDFAFAECGKLSDVTLGAGITYIGCSTFFNDWSIENIYCYAYDAPLTCDNAFGGLIKKYVNFYVPNDRVHHYQLNPFFTEFNIRAIGANNVDSGDDVIVIPSDRDAIFTWPSNSNASSYTLQITKDGEVFCTLVFNEYGQLTGIAFAPARNGEHHPRQTATATTNGWQFTVTGLNEGSAYAFTLDVKDAANKVLNSYNGTFRTEGGTEETTLWTLSVYSDNPEWGSVTGAGTYEDGTEAIIEAIPAMGYRFLYWNDNNTANPRTVLMTADATYTAYFDHITQGTDDLSSDMLAHPCKVLENGTIYILLPDGRKLNMQGAEVK